MEDSPIPTPSFSPTPEAGGGSQRNVVTAETLESVIIEACPRHKSKPLVNLLPGAVYTRSNFAGAIYFLFNAPSAY
ncbi:hypothetical protein J6590_097395 [Homalodisca vitripennis]|nr:hypothetical protein J6590_097395 [Homalodisca vitripennis]